MARLTRGVRYTLIGAATLVVVLAVALYVLTRTDFGVEQAGRFTVDQLRSSVNGELRVDRVTSGGLLRGATLHDVSITDPDGRLFLRADSARLAYHLRTLVGGDISFDRLVLYSPEVFIERLPGREQWNYQIVFPGDTTTAADTTTARSLIRISDATVVNGLVVVRMPWEPEQPVVPADTARLILEEVPGGLVRTVRFEDVDARLPRILWESPDEEGRVIEVGELATRAYVWETPADVERAEAVITVRDSLLSFDAPLVRLPSSDLAVVGQVVLAEEGNRYDIEAEGEDLAFSDFQWLYPPLPDDGGGSLRFRIQSRGPNNLLWLARDARIAAAGSEIAGSFGIVTGDTLYFTNVDLRADPLDVELLQSLLPVELPLEGLLIGTVEVEGPVSALETRGHIRYATGPTAESDVRWSGTISARPPYTVSNLEATARRVDPAHLARWVPELRTDGPLRGGIRADGDVQRGLRIEGGVQLEHAGARSGVRGSGRIALGGATPQVDLQLEADAIALDLLNAHFPAAVPLAGSLQGPVRVTGTPEDLRIDADLVTSGGGVSVAGRVGGLYSARPTFRLAGSVERLDLHRLLPDLPETQVTGRFEVDGAGRAAEDLTGQVQVDLLDGEIAGVGLLGGVARGAVRDGVATVDTLQVETVVGTARARGTLSWSEHRAGELEVSVRLDAPEALEPLLFDEPAPAPVPLLEQARLAGVVTGEAVVRGTWGQWSATGEMTARGLRYDGSTLDGAHLAAAWSDGRLDVEATVDSLRHGDRLLAGARATATIHRGSGTVRLLGRGAGVQELTTEGGFDIHEDGSATLRLQELTVATANAGWVLKDSVVANVGPTGVRVDTFVMARAPEAARIRIAGTLPWQPVEPDPGSPRGRVSRHPGTADLLVELESVPVGEILAISQTPSLIDGIASGQVTLLGTALEPRIQGRVMARPFRYGDAVVDSAGVALDYRDRRLTGRFAGWRGTSPVVSGDAVLPVDLALSPREDRVIEGPVRLAVRTDSLPVPLLAFLAPGFRDLEGLLDGQAAVLGTTAEPELRGELRLTNGSAFFEPLNVRYDQVRLVANMAEGSRLDLEGALRTGDGEARLRGSVDLAVPSDPSFDLTVAAERLQAARRRDIVAVASGSAHLGGRYRRPVVTGSLRMDEGEVHLDEMWRQYQIVQLDTSLFQRFDTTTVRYRPPPENPFLANVRLDGLSLTADRDVWVRSREVDIEVIGTVELVLDRQVDDLRLTGSLEASRGTYNLQLARGGGLPARRFEIREGTVEFMGTPGVDPRLQISAGYNVRRAQGDPIDVLAQVTGTLRQPRVALTSDSDLPLSESDLASYILFGRAGAELSQAETDVVSSSLVGLVRPALTGLASSELQRVATSLGIPVDYITLRAPEYGLGDYREVWGGDQNLGALAVLQETQLEVGMDLFEDVFVVGSVRLTSETAGTETRLAPRWGGRIEYRFLPTWTWEVFLEDRFARTPSFGLAEIDNRTMIGASIFREWGY